MAVMLAAGIHLLLLAVVELWRRLDTISLLLALWLGGGFVFAAVLNWTVSARSFLPLAPVAAILVTRAVTRKASETPAQNKFLRPLAFSFGVSLLLAVADFSLANSARTAARELAAKYKSSGSHLWFQSHWGFQFYLQKSGASPVDFALNVLSPGELIIIPANNTDVISPNHDDVELVGAPAFETLPWLSTVNWTTGAGFYGDGFLPFVFGPVPVEKYFVLRVLRALCFAPPEDLNNQAWRLATSPDQNVRDGTTAVLLAQLACKATHFHEASMVGTLAAAYAEAGRFDDAISTAQKACALASESGQQELLKKNQELLELYRAHQPYREK
jgi:hypothetical protein